MPEAIAGRRDATLPGSQALAVLRVLDRVIAATISSGGAVPHELAGAHNSLRRALTLEAPNRNEPQATAERARPRSIDEPPHGDSPSPLLLTYGQAAELLSCSTDTVGRRVADGTLVAVGHGSGKRITAASVDVLAGRTTT